MDPIEVDFEFPRGNTFAFSFQLVTADKKPIHFEPDEGEIYFTVKTAYRKNDYVIQKKYSDGDIEYIDDGTYCVILKPDDTNEKVFGTYGYDVTIKTGDLVRTCIIGQLELTKNFTHKDNE